MAYLLSNICTKITGIGQLLLKLIVGAWVVSFLRYSVEYFALVVDFVYVLVFRA